jgi:8-oxo-dGTP pyrophosphatase MutT (NUDIX family)
MQKFKELLKNEIGKGLPGTEVQLQMLSYDRKKMNFPVKPGKDTKAASVLILLYPHKASVFTVFMQRPEYKGIHSGQISFPGGKKEPSDKDPIATALREAHEETGVDPLETEVLGVLTPLFIPVSNIVVTPVVGWTDSKPLFKCQEEEVVFLFEADVYKFYDPSLLKHKPLNILSETYEVKYFDYEGNMIWGATAMIFNELLAIIRRGGIPPPA